MNPHQFILLVEDSNDDIELTRRLIRKIDADIELVVARNGKEALDMIFGSHQEVDGAWKPFLVLLDLNMPKLNGLVVLQCLRADAVMRDIPAIVTSASKEVIDVIESQNLGASAYLSKPLDPRKLAELIKKYKHLASKAS